MNESRRASIPQEVLDIVWRRDQGKCVKCESQELIEFDHIIPFSKGGSNTPRNLQILCQKCNREKSNKIGLEG
jgi:5-methylcytosine-specific restriction endonuclease McrA